jgi:hypothetical protein
MTPDDVWYLGRVFSDNGRYELMTWVKDYFGLNASFYLDGRVEEGKKLDAHLDRFVKLKNASKGVLLPFDNPSAPAKKSTRENFLFLK